MICTGRTAEADEAYIGAGQSLRQARHRMRELGVAALPARGDDGKLQGIVTGHNGGRSHRCG